MLPTFVGVDHLALTGRDFFHHHVEFSTIDYIEPVPKLTLVVDRIAGLVHLTFHLLKDRPLLSRGQVGEEEVGFDRYLESLQLVLALGWHVIGRGIDLVKLPCLKLGLEPLVLETVKGSTVQPP